MNPSVFINLNTLRKLISFTPNPLITFIFIFLLVFFITPFFRKLAIRFKILDFPDTRKVHKEPTPLFGGLAIYVGVILGLGLNYSNLHLFAGLIIGATIILIFGLIDDIKGISANIRIIAQFIATLIMIGFGIRLSFLPNNLWGNMGEIILTLIWTIGITNALNYLDGIDGLAGGTAVIATVFFSIISFQTNQPGISTASLILMASCLGFLPYNFRNAKIFLGDAGSTFIGFTLAGIAIMGNWAEDNIVKLTVPILILGVPIFDMVFTTIMRIVEGKIRTIIEWLKYGGNDHFHHRLINLGLYPTETLFLICFVNISLGINAIMVSNERYLAGILSILQAAIIFAVIAILMVIGKRRGRG